MPARLNPSVSANLNKPNPWKTELNALRKIVLECDLSEALKWRVPCYTVNGGNVLIIHGFKEYFALLFFKGVLLKDPKKIIVVPTENSQSGRQIRFKSLAEVTKLKKTLKAYINEAIAIEKAGLKVQLKKTSDFKVPAEFQAALKKNAALKAAYSALTPGRQRGYLLYFGGAKQSETRSARVEKYTKKILAGKGFDD